nr:DUF6518 family protein [Micromonospora sp. DSM 115978]
MGLEDGTSADLQGLRSVAVMTAVWLGGSLVAGPVLGLLGHVVRVGRTRSAAVGAGVTCGLLSGEGWQTRPWLLLGADPHHAEFIQGSVISELAKFALLLAIVAWLVRSHRLRRAWPTLLLAATGSGLLSALAWHALFAVTNRI